MFVGAPSLEVPQENSALRIRDALGHVGCRPGRERSISIILRYRAGDAAHHVTVTSSPLVHEVEASGLVIGGE
jgi:hypothetical protein